MATDIHRLPVAESLPQGTNIDQATDAISRIMTGQSAPAPAEPERPRAAPDESMETPDVAPVGDEVEATDEPRMDANEQEQETPDVVSEPETADSEEDATEEVELDPSQLAALLGLEESDLVLSDEGALSFRTKIDGESAAVALKDLRDSYQIQKTAQQRLSKLGEERKAFEAERTNALQYLAQQAETMVQTVNLLEKEYSADWDSVDWNKLRDEDPTQFSLKRADFDDRKQRLEGYKKQVGEEITKAQMAQAEREHAMRITGDQQLAEVFSGPKWASAPKWDKAAMKELEDFILQTEGFPEQVYRSNVYWQPLVWAREAMMYRKLMADSEKAVKRVVRLPKVSKPGATKTKKQVRQTRLSEHKARQRKAGGTLDATAQRISAIIRGS